MRKMKTITIERKPRKCPVCGNKVVKIVYGMPGPELMEQAMSGEVILGGGCIISDESTTTGIQLDSYLLRLLQGRERGPVRQEAQAAGGFR